MRTTETRNALVTAEDVRMIDKYIKHAWEVIRNVPRHGEASAQYAYNPDLQRSISRGDKQMAINTNTRLF